MGWNYYIHLDGFTFIYVAVENHVGIIVPPEADLRNTEYVNALSKALARFDYIETFIQVREKRHQWYEIENAKRRDEEIDRQTTIDQIKKLMRQKVVTMPGWLSVFLHDVENGLPELKKFRVRPPAKGYSAGFVYLIKSPDSHYKIGRTKNPKERMNSFGVQLPFEIERICLISTSDMQRLESELHERFADKRLNGEWFALSPEDVEYIRGLAT